MASFEAVEHLWPSEATWAAAAGALKGTGPALENHLWQSTVFALAAGLLALALRRNHARARYWIWMAASLKFVLPFALLAAIGSHFARPRVVAAPAQQTMYFAVEDFSEPFAAPIAPLAPVAAPSPWRAEVVVPLAVAGIWLAGFLSVLGGWCLRWRRVARDLRKAAPMREGREVDALRRIEQAAGLRAQIELRLSEAAMEPGIFGIARPVLAWPAGISARLDDAQLEAVLAHEVCHVRRCDNLTAALHMLVEAVFWFHPLVWWLGGRLLAERERACGEEVLLVCARPQAYAESILKVCEFCVESPLQCVSGVTGADLKQRVVAIMTGRIALRLTLGRKLLIAIAALCAVAVPVLLGQAQAARRMMLAAAASAPKPLQAAVHAMVAEEGAPAAPSSQEGSSDDSVQTRKQFAFEVFSIRPERYGSERMPAQITPDGYRVSFTFEDAIMWAYNPRDPKTWYSSKVLNAPSWVANDLFDIDARVAPADVAAWQQAQADRNDLPLLNSAWQAVLKECCNIVLHRTPIEVPYLNLAVGKGGAKLKDTVPGEDTESGALKSLQGKGIPMPLGKGFWAQENGEAQFVGVSVEELARALMILNQSHSNDSPPIQDKTGLTGRYDFTLPWYSYKNYPDRDFNKPLDRMPIGRIGLTLKPGKGPAYIFNIDHIERPPVNGAEVSAPASGITREYSRYAEFTNSFKSEVSPLRYASYAQATDGAAKAAAAARPAFEAATIKPNVSDCCTSSKMSADQMLLTHETLKNLIVLAYAVQPYQVVVPDWMENVRFDITGKYPAGTKYDDRWAMLRTLQEDRFGLKVHRDTKEMTGYSLVVASGGFKLKPSEPGEGNTVGGNQGNVWTFRAYKVGMPVLAWELSDSLGEVVVDKTGLGGEYDYTLRWANNGPNNPSAADTDAPSVFTALEDTLGLRLQHGKVQADVIVVDHAERAPTEN